MEGNQYQPNAGEFEDMPTWEVFFCLSRAYIEASTCLCNAMIEDDFSKQYSSTRVILHLARQGLELFFKGAIFHKTSALSRNGHNIDKLLSEYLNIYSADQFHFKVPSAFSLRNELDLFPGLVDSFHLTLDQRHRYPMDLKGQSFATPELFEPKNFLLEIEKLSAALMIIEFCHIRGK